MKLEGHVKRTAEQLGIVTLLTLVCVAAAVAREGAQEATARGNQPGSVVTISGCLLQISSSGTTIGGNAPDGTAAVAGPINQPSTAAATGEERFILAIGQSARRYLVTGLSRDDLRKHIHHEVELSGRVEESPLSGSAGTPAAGDRLGGTASPSTAARIGELPRLAATSLRVVAGACSASRSSD
jgi:hypothetical protein